MKHNRIIRLVLIITLALMTSAVYGQAVVSKRFIKLLDDLDIPAPASGFRAPFDLVVHPLRQFPFGDGTEPDIALVNLEGQTVVVYHYSGFGDFTYNSGVASMLPAGTFANSIAAGFELMRNELNLNSVAVDLAVSDSGFNGGGVRVLDNDEGSGLFPLPKTQFGDIANNHPLVGDGSMPTRDEPRGPGAVWVRPADTPMIVTRAVRT